METHPVAGQVDDQSPLIVATCRSGSAAGCEGQLEKGLQHSVHPELVVPRGLQPWLVAVLEVGFHRLRPE